MAPEHSATWEAYLQQTLGDFWQVLGTVSGEGTAAQLQIYSSDQTCLINASLAVMGDRWENAIANRLSVSTGI
ncbi:hypothetical protein [Neosynechococcus sphagnicola]|uniref:hypothetical protein n=1 Tax=Neosynechococcus sphagnicola TaxID=1501145 RepID=UPI0030843D03